MNGRLEGEQPQSGDLRTVVESYLLTLMILLANFDDPPGSLSNFNPHFKGEEHMMSSFQHIDC